MKIRPAAIALWGAFLMAAGGQAIGLAQDSSLYQSGAPTRLHHGSWTHVQLPPLKELKVHDIVNVRVDKLARTQSEGSLERRKNMLYDAVLSDWVHLIGLKALKPNAQNDGDQRVRGQLQRLLRAEADNETRESLAFEITCTIADIRPNGTLVLEGHEQIQVNDESWEVSLIGHLPSGRHRPGQYGVQQENPQSEDQEARTRSCT